MLRFLQNSASLFNIFTMAEVATDVPNKRYYIELEIRSVEHGICPMSIAELCSNFGDSAITKGQIAYFLLRMRKTVLFLLHVKNMTSSSCSPTPIFYNTREFWRYVNI